MEYITRFSLKPNKAEEFRQFMRDNDDKLTATSPEGWTYLGTYLTVRGFGDCDCKSRWELTDIGALANPFRDPIHDVVFGFIHDSRPMTSTLLKKLVTKST